jgi:hypothetical protein
MKPGVVVQNHIPSTQEAQPGGSLVWGQPGIHNETLCQYPCEREKDTQRKREREYGNEANINTNSQEIKRPDVTRT